MFIVAIFAVKVAFLTVMMIFALEGVLFCPSAVAYAEHLITCVPTSRFAIVALSPFAMLTPFSNHS